MLFLFTFLFHVWLDFFFTTACNIQLKVYFIKSGLAIEKLYIYFVKSYMTYCRTRYWYREIFTPFALIVRMLSFLVPFASVWVNLRCMLRYMYVHVSKYWKLSNKKLGTFGIWNLFLMPSIQFNFKSLKLGLVILHQVKLLESLLQNLLIKKKMIVFDRTL